MQKDKEMRKLEGQDTRQRPSVQASQHPGVLASRHSSILTSQHKPIDRWKNLEVWKLADEFAFQIYKGSKHFPKEETYGLTSQLRRSALSIPTNIVEGYSKRGDKELAHFVNIALGSLAEAKYLLYFASRLDYLDQETYERLINEAEELGAKLWKFYEKVRES